MHFEPILVTTKNRDIGYEYFLFLIVHFHDLFKHL